MMTKAPLFYEKKYGNFGSAKYGNVKVLQQKLPLTFFLLLAQLFFSFQKKVSLEKTLSPSFAKKMHCAKTERERETEEGETFTIHGHWGGTRGYKGGLRVKKSIKTERVSNS